MKNCFIICLYFMLFPFVTIAQRYRVKHVSAQRLELTRALDTMPDSAALTVVKPYKDGVDKEMSPVLGMSRVAMSAGKPESLLGNWVADVLVEGSTCAGGPKADFGLANVGSLRSRMPEGIVRRGDILQISPFENNLVVLEMKGKDVLELMRNIAAVKGEAVSREVRMEMDAEGNVLQVRIGGKEIDKKRTYLIATLDYLAEGNDRLYALKKHKRRHETGMSVREIMMESVVKNRVIDSRIEGRIVMKK
jgi:2',3'-cyclic-nucleotide 2'-phosphodiesterase (5'-nucleotidase family)